MEYIFSSLNPVNVFILITMLHFLSTTGLVKKDFFLLLILTISLSNETLLIYNQQRPINIELCISLYIIFNAFFWFCILQKQLTYDKIFRYCMAFYLAFSLYIVFFEGRLKINKITFVLGAFIYLAFVFFESFYQLKKENLSFFDSNRFIIIIAPVVFFFGFSLMFGFIKKEIRSTIVYHNINLYTFVSYYTNIIYYTIINIYIFKERKLRNE